MDDTTSRQQIDELADLYLTSPGQAGAATGEAAPSAIDGPAPIKLAPKVAPNPQANQAPDTAPPTTPEAEQTPALTDTTDADDSHPMLRLTDDEKVSETFSAEDEAAIPFSEDQPTQETQMVSDTVLEPAPQAMLEAVVMGNLPGMSGPWLTQYAQLLAQGEGPVILLHLGDEAIDLELIEPRAEAQPAPAQPPATVRIPPMRGDKTGLVGLIDALVRSDTAPARTILVRFDTIGDSQALSRLAAMQDWTMLCGSDDASIAAASRQIRTAVQTDPRLAEHHVGVMIMGSDDHAAQQAADRIENELEHDLVHPVELVGHLKRMQPVQVRDLGSFPDPVALWPKLVSFFDSLETPEPLPEAPATQDHEVPAAQATTQATPTPAPAPAAQPSALDAIPRIAPKPVAAPTPPPRPAAAASRPSAMPRFRQAPPKPTPTAPIGNTPIAGGLRPPDKQTTNASTQPAPQQQATPTPSEAHRSPATDNDLNAPPTNAPQPTAPPAPQPIATPTRSAPTPRVLTPQPELDLVALIGQGPAALNNPITLDARIPDQPSTQLAVDAQGTVHILLQKGTASFNEATLQLLDAGQWVRDHLELIALTQRDHDFVDTAPVLHLLTDRADETAASRGRLAGQIKLHLLQEVTLGKETGWFCTPLG